MTDLPGRLESLVRSTPWLLEALRAARDVDLAFFDPIRLDPARDAEVEQASSAAAGHYHRRVLDKRVAERWPRAEIVLEGQDVP